ncbi:MAG: tRNA (N6-threonylcarbamoyladenosine(37)-N6)-methyltransferase TrmO [Lachnospiraceae bacterium]|nr:tRNA (N6-threonylcarbamoyladenosine(37)-N6)-methyltransferase TrmO [Lachnospiraceae bacterium]
MKIIGHMRTDFPQKFGVPRQSGLVANLQGRIVFEPEYRNIDALKGMEQYDYLWILWQFEGTEREHWSPTVRPPRLGGETHMGVFATRSPFRPNPIGLSSVKLERIELTEDGPVIHVSGIDMRDNTPILDIKPYLPYTDSHPGARDGFAGGVKNYELSVEFPPELLERFPSDKRSAAIDLLKQDPRPAYQEDPDRVYGVAFAGKDIKFTVDKGVLYVKDIADI